MAACANPSANTNGSNNNGNGTANSNNNINDGSCAAVPENSSTGASERALKHKVSLSVEWTRDEQSLLEQLLAKYASDSTVVRYAKIAGKLQDKTVRDVALRCRWMTKKENGRRRKDDNNLSRKQKDKKEKVADQHPKPSFHPTNHADGSMDIDDGISYKAIGGATGQFLEQNAKALDQISANFSAFKVHENIDLFWQTRNNIVAILNDLNDTPEIMKQMPPLPVKLNDELANSIFPTSSMRKQS